MKSYLKNHTIHTTISTSGNTLTTDILVKRCDGTPNRSRTAQNDVLWLCSFVLTQLSTLISAHD